MIILKSYQQEAVDDLIKSTYSLLRTPGGRLKMIFDAPTGAGKTVTMAAFINKFCEELPDKIDLEQKQVAFVWIAPNQLHLQSFDSLKSYFSELRSVKPIRFEDITDRRLKAGEVLFLNWQSINKESNLFIKDNENDQTIIGYINNSRLHNIEIILILDEAHLFASKGKAAQEFMQSIYAKIEIEVSATPMFRQSAKKSVQITRHEVIEAGMIKKGVVLNPLLNSHEQNQKSLNQILLEQALAKKKQLENGYKKLGININPLLLIQLPNDSKSETVIDLKVVDEITSLLKIKNITEENHRLATWLSSKKVNLDFIEKPDSMVDVLLFKQAIALGWDCPRAAVLLIFREIKEETFTIQTVGRILRMPEQKHYQDLSLNYGYVFTNLSRDVINIVKDDMDYIVQNKAIRSNGYKPIGLNSFFINTRLERNRLSSKFRRCLYDAADELFDLATNPEVSGTESIFIYNERRFKECFIELDVNNIEISIPKNVNLSPDIGVTYVEQVERFAKTKSELDILFRQFCRNHVGKYAKVDSSPVLELALKLFFEDYLGASEFQAIKIILYDQNRPRFVDLIDRAIDKHEYLLKQKASQASKLIEESKWDVPVERIYNEFYREQSALTHALQPFYEFINTSKTEKEFVDYLETNREYISWWYKNGVRNKEDFAITYIGADNIIKGFYVDFVIMLKNGLIALFDTKTPDSDSDFCGKHNALIQYVRENTTPEKPIIGGIIVSKGAGKEQVWRYAPTEITEPRITSEWVSFIPALGR